MITLSSLILGYLLGFPHSSGGKEPACNTGDSGSIPGLGRSPGEGRGYTLQDSWASLVKNHLQCGRPGFDPWVGKTPWRRERLPMPGFWPGEFMDCTDVPKQTLIFLLSGLHDVEEDRTHSHGDFDVTCLVDSHRVFD